MSEVRLIISNIIRNYDLKYAGQDSLDGPADLLIVGKEASTRESSTNLMTGSRRNAEVER